MLDIFIKEFKHNIRSKNALLLRILFPLVLMLILGTVFGSSIFSKDSSLDEDVEIVVYNDGNSTISEALDIFLDEMSNQSISYSPIDSEEDGIRLVESGKYPCFISAKNNKVRVYIEKTSSFDVVYLQTTLEAFRQNYNLVGTMISNRLSPEIDFENNMDFVKLSSTKESSDMSALDYYGVTMLTLIIMYSIPSVVFSITLEYIENTIYRIRQMPISIFKFFIGKLFGNLIITILQAAILIIISYFALGVNYGNNFGYVVLVLLSQVILCSCIGIAVGVASKKHAVAQSAISVLIPVLSFLGGAYYPLEKIGSSFLNRISVISPIKWINDAIFDLTYFNAFDKVPIAIGINMTLSVLVLIIASYKLNRAKEVQ